MTSFRDFVQAQLKAARAAQPHLPKAKRERNGQQLQGLRQLISIADQASAQQAKREAGASCPHGLGRHCSQCHPARRSAV